jgi:hypothetical protein
VQLEGLVLPLLQRLHDAAVHECIRTQNLLGAFFLTAGELLDQPLEQVARLALDGVQQLVVPAVAQEAKLFDLGGDRGTDAVSGGDVLGQSQGELESTRNKLLDGLSFI